LARDETSAVDVSRYTEIVWISAQTEIVNAAARLYVKLTTIRRGDA
jgi:hypothetical protein